MLITLPALIGVIACVAFGCNGENVTDNVLGFYFAVVILIVVSVWLWGCFFDESYKEWKKIKEKNNNKRLVHDKEMQRMKEEMEEMRRRLDDRWDNF